MDRDSRNIIRVSKVVTGGREGAIRTRLHWATHLLWLLVIASCETATPVATRAPGARADLAREAPAEWSEPVNLGAPINTAAIESAPALSADGLTLYFASDRPGGFGGTDLWVSHRATPESPWE